MTDYDALVQLKPEAERYPPVTENELAELSASVQGPFPESYLEFLGFSNGIFVYSGVVFSATEAMKFNQDAWGEGFAELYMPFNGMFFFGADANSDWFFFRKLSGGMDGNVYVWRHESDSRVWLANNLSEFLHLYLSDKYDSL
jgi:SMI1-KNR4 cell-wall